MVMNINLDLVIRYLKVGLNQKEKYIKKILQIYLMKKKAKKKQ